MYCLGRDHSLQPVLQMEEACCRQQLPTTYVLNGALYLASRSFFLREKAFVAGETAGYVMPVERSVDIDTPLDWQWAEFLRGKRYDKSFGHWSGWFHWIPSGSGFAVGRL